MKQVRVFVDRQELTGYTELTLERKKDDMTGSLSIGVFMGWLPSAPVAPEASAGREILVYIGSKLAFSGYIDKRIDTASTDEDETNNDSYNLSIGPNQYSVRFTARGKTKYLIDSSHQHPTGTMLQPTNREIFEKLLEPWDVQLDWQATTIKLDKQRFRDGGRVVDELQRVAEQCSLYVTETFDGKLRVTDETSEASTGEALALGVNILNFSTTQDEHVARSDVTVKGQRIEKNVWGDQAVIPTLLATVDKTVQSFIPATIQLYGNATEELLDRRAKYEANKRNSQAKKITLDVFGVLQTSGAPWDIGLNHQVSIPPAGISGTFEVIGIKYDVQEDQTLKTTLTLAPPPVKAGSEGKGLSGVKAANNKGGGSSNWSSPDVQPAAPETSARPVSRVQNEPPTEL